MYMREEPKVVICNGQTYGFAGDNSLFMPMIEWCEAGAKPADYPKIGEARFTLIVPKAKQALLYTSESPYVSTHPYPCAVGTGADIAYGALAAGTSVLGACRIAADIDLGSGKPVKSEIVMIRKN